MAKWRFDPGDYATGTLPSVWAEEGASGFAYIENSAWGRALRINAVSPLNYSNAATRALVFSPVGFQSGTVEIVAKLVIPSSTSLAIPAIRIWSTFGEAYALLVNDFSNYARIDRFYDTSSYVTIGSNITFDPGTSPFYVRIRHDGDYLYAKIWKEGTSEPSSWTWTIQDNVLLSGKLGILPPSTYWSSYIWLLWFGAATGSDKAPLDYELSGVSKVSALKLTADIIRGETVDSSLKLTSPSIDGGGNAVEVVDAGLKLVSPVADGSGNQVEVVDVGLKFTSPVADGSGTLVEVVDTSLKLSSPVVDGAGVPVEVVNSSLKFASPTTDGAGVPVEVVQAGLKLTSPTTDGTGVPVEIVNANLKLASPTTDGVGVPVEVVNSSLKLTAPAVDGQANEVREAEVALKLTNPTTDGAGIPVEVVSANLKFANPTTDGRANEVRDLSASLELISPTTDGQANEVRDVSSSLKLTSPAIDGSSVPVEVVSAGLKFTGLTTDGQANEVRDVSSSLKLTAPTTDGQANEVRDVSTSLALSPVAIAGQTLAETSDVQALLQLAGPRAFGYLISLTDLNVSLALGSPQVIANAFRRDYLWGRTRVSALKLAAGIENAGQAGGQLSAGPLKLLARVYKVPAGVANVNLGTLGLNARGEVLDRLTHADVTIDEAILLDTILAD